MAEKNAFGVEMRTMADKKKEEQQAKMMQADSIYAHLDTDGDGVITDEEMARAKEILGEVYGEETKGSSG